MNFLALETRRADGTRVATPMWFVEEGGHIYMRTDSRSPKIKRIRKNPSVRIAPCTFRGAITGEWRDARAKLLSADQTEAINQLVRKQYGVFKRLIDLRNRIKGISIVAVEIEVV